MAIDKEYNKRCKKRWIDELKISDLSGFRKEALKDAYGVYNNHGVIRGSRWWWSMWFEYEWACNCLY